MNWRPPLRGCHAPTRPRHSGWPDASFPAWPPWTPRPGSAVTEGATADLEDNLPSRDCPARASRVGRPGREGRRPFSEGVPGSAQLAEVCDQLIADSRILADVELLQAQADVAVQWLIPLSPSRRERRRDAVR